MGARNITAAELQQFYEEGTGRKEPLPGSGGLIPGAIYARQSKYLLDSASRPVQIKTCKGAAPYLGIEVVHVISEQASGYKDRGLKRPDYLKLIEMVESAEIRAVLVYTSERLSRGGGPGWAPLITAFEKAGIQMDPRRYDIPREGGVALPSGWMSEAEVHWRAVADREEAKKIQLRNLDIAANKAARGLPSGGGRRPYGYTDQKFTKLVPKEARILREARDRLFAGESRRSICMSFEKRKILTVTGLPWVPGSLSSKLINPHLAGIRVHKSDGQIVAAIEGNWPRIFSKEDHYRLVELVGKIYRQGEGEGVQDGEWISHQGAVKEVPRRLLTGTFMCSLCEGPLQGARRTQINKATGRREPQYACAHRGCMKLAAKAEPIEKRVREEVLYLLSKPLARRALAAGQSPEHLQALMNEEAQLIRVREEHRSAFAAKGGAYLPPEEYSKILEDNGRQLAAIQSDLKKKRSKISVPDDYDELVRRWDEDLDFARSLVAAIFEKIYLLPAGKTFDRKQGPTPKRELRFIPRPAFANFKPIEDAPPPNGGRAS